MAGLALGIVWAGYAIGVYGWSVVKGTGLTFGQVVWPGKYGSGASSTSATATSSSAAAPSKANNFGYTGYGPPNPKATTS